MNPSVTLWQYEWKQKGRSERTLRYMTSELDRFSKWLELPLESATVTHCLAYLAERAQTSQYGAFAAWRALRSFYACVANLDGTPSPMGKISAPRMPEPAVKSITPAEYKQMLLVCGSDNRDKAILSLLYCTGLRRAELAALTMDDVNIDQRLLTVRKSKTGKPRVVPMSPDAHVYLLKYLRTRAKSKHSASPALWLGVKGTLTADGMRLVIARRSKQAGLQVSSHQFRRAFAVKWLTDGGSQVSLMSICGWNSSAMPAKYTRHAAGEVAEAEYRRLYG